MGIVSRRQEKFRSYLEGELQPGETVEASISFAQTGPSPWTSLLTTLYIFWVKYLGVAVTSQRVVIVRRSKMTNRIKRVESTHARADVRVNEWEQGKLFSTLRLGLRDEALKLNVHRMHRAEGEQVVQALTTGETAPWKAQ